MSGLGRIGCWLGLLSMLALSACAVLPGSAASADRPNILFVLVDDLGFADFSVSGNRRVATPHIDALAADGLLMTQFYVGSPICSPSRAAFLTASKPSPSSGSMSKTIRSGFS